MAAGGARDATRRSASSCWRSPTWLCGQRDLHLELRGFKARQFAGRVFGAELGRCCDRPGAGAPGWARASDGVGAPDAHACADGRDAARRQPAARGPRRPGRACSSWLRSREMNNARRHGVEQLARTLVEMGVLSDSPFGTQPSREEWLARSQAGEIDVPAVWLDWTRRWFETSTLSRSSRTHTYYGLIKAGRWLYRRASGPDRSGFVGSAAGRRVDRGGRRAEGRRAIEVAEHQLHARPLRRAAVARAPRRS